MPRATKRKSATAAAGSEDQLKEQQMAERVAALVVAQLSKDTSSVLPAQKKRKTGKQHNVTTESGNSSSDSSESDGENSSESGSDSDSEMCHQISSSIVSVVSDKIKQKIWADKYVNFDELLPNFRKPIINHNIELQRKYGSSTFTLCKAAPRQTIRTIYQWTSAFMRFLAIYSQKFPTLTADVLKHAEIVRDLASRRSGDSWLLYDKQVRMDREARGTLWGSIHMEYWVMAVTPFQGQPFQRKGHFNKQRQNSIPRGFCISYNRRGTCFSNACQYKHFCCQCKRKHPLVHCPSTNVTPGTSSSNQYGQATVNTSGATSAAVSNKRS